MVKRTDSPFASKVLEFPLPSKFRLPPLEPNDGLKDPLDYITTFKITLSMQQTLDEIVCRSFPTTLKLAVRVWFSKLAQSSINDSEQLSSLFVHTLLLGDAKKGQRIICSWLGKRKGNHWDQMWSDLTGKCWKWTTPTIKYNWLRSKLGWSPKSL